MFTEEADGGGKSQKITDWSSISWTELGQTSDSRSVSLIVLTCSSVNLYMYSTFKYPRFKILLSDHGISNLVHGMSMESGPG